MAVTTTTREVHAPRRTAVQRAAQIGGWAFVLLGVAGFFASGANMESHPDLAPRLLGVFPVNLLHNVVHLISGFAGIAASRSFGASKAYCRTVAVVYGLLIALAFIDPTTFGLIPIGGPMIWLHVALAAWHGIFGFAAGSRPTETVVTTSETPRATDEVVYTDTTNRRTP